LALQRIAQKLGIKIGIKKRGYSLIKASFKKWRRRDYPWGFYRESLLGNTANCPFSPGV